MFLNLENSCKGKKTLKKVKDLCQDNSIKNKEMIKLNCILSEQISIPVLNRNIFKL